MVKRLTIFFVLHVQKMSHDNWELLEMDVSWNSSQNKTQLQPGPGWKSGLSWANNLGLTKGSTFPCCSQYCISSLAHVESLTLGTVSSRRSCSTKMRCVCKSLLLFPEGPEGITTDILLNCISLKFFYPALHRERVSFCKEPPLVTLYWKWWRRTIWISLIACY